MLDIDFFKKINDTHGHHIGDQVLQELVKRLNTSMRFFDICVRLGGEEFALIMPDATLASALSVAERLRTEVAATPFTISAPPYKINVTMSMGVSGSDDGQAEAGALFEQADKALYKAKETGRNRVLAEKDL
jgi:two-component system cell cycle response regulator